MTPKLSVITITFNSVKTLERTIESVLNQGYENLEYIIIDGGSTDGTQEIIKKYKKVLGFWCSEPDKGISDAFNKGIKAATGDLIWIINSDDGLMPGAVNALMRQYSPEIDVYRGKTVLRGELITQDLEYEPSMKISLLGISNVNHPSTIISKRAYEKNGLYDENCRYYMDLDILYRLYNSGAKFCYVEYPLAFFTWGGTTSNAFTKKRKEELTYVLRKNGVSNFNIWIAQTIRWGKRQIKKIIGMNTASIIHTKIRKNR